MKIFDLNVHLIPGANEAKEILQTQQANLNIAVETVMQKDDYLRYLTQKKEELLAHFKSANFMFFNTRIMDDGSLGTVVSHIKTTFPGSICTALFDFRKPLPLERLDNLKQLGFDAIKFHWYVQRIQKQDFEIIRKIAFAAQEKKMSICVCSSFGTSQMYEFNGLEVACAIANAVEKAPIILLHAGGAKIIDAMLLAHDRKNVFLETSFSLPYYEGSSIFSDFAFAFRKIGADRVLYGSDFPAVDFRESANNIDKFFGTFNFSDSDREKILHANAFQLFPP